MTFLSVSRLSRLSVIRGWSVWYTEGAESAVTSRGYFIAGALVVALAAATMGTLQYARNRRDRAGVPGQQASAQAVTVRFFREPKPVPSFAVTTIDGRTL